MGLLLSWIFFIWFVGLMFSAAYFWAKRTSRTDAPVVRRFKAMGYGAAWPVLLARHFSSADKRAENQRRLDDRQKKILGDDGDS